MKAKLYIVVIASIAGVLFQNGLHTFFTAFMLALCFLLVKNKHHLQLLLVSLASFLYFLVTPFHNVPHISLDNTSLVGKITSIPNQDGNHLSFQMKSTDNLNIQVHYYMKTIDQKQELKILEPGMLCSFQGVYQSPKSDSNFNGFDYQKYLASRNIYYVFRPNEMTATNCMKGNFNVIDSIKTMRQRGIEQVNVNFPEQSRGIASALVFGDKSEVAYDVLNAYQSLGVIHLLAVSGLHVGLISTSVFFLLIRIGFTRERSIDLLLILIPIYCVIAGAASSVLRASAMCIVVLLSLKYKMRISPLDSISGICLLLLFINPQYVFQLGFQLSFIVSFCLIASTKIYESYCTNKVTQIIAVSLIAQIVSFPVIIYNFYEFSPYSLLLNLLYVPFVSLVVLPLSLLSFLVFLISPFLGNGLVYILNELLSVSHDLLLAINQLPFSSITFGKPSDLIVVLYYLAVGFHLFTLEQKRSKESCIGSGMVICLVIIVHWVSPYISPYGEVTIIDVGQGDSIYIELPRRKTVYLIDTGGNVRFDQDDWKKRKKRFDVGEDIVVPFLKAKGVRTIDKLILTHGHYDHIGGAFALLDEMNVKQLLYGAGPIENEIEKRLLEEFEKRGTEIQFVKEGGYWSVEDSYFYVLSPQGSEKTLNDRSIVIYSAIGGLRWLFTGDLEEEGEIRITSTYDPLPVDVLKVGHHGSITSTTEQLLKHINPRVALISVGENNRHNHPHPEVITRLENFNTITYRTDKDGAIKFRFHRKRGGVFKTAH